MWLSLHRFTNVLSAGVQQIVSINNSTTCQAEITELSVQSFPSPRWVSLSKREALTRFALSPTVPAVRQTLGDAYMRPEEILQKNSRMQSFSKVSVDRST